MHSRLNVEEARQFLNRWSDGSILRAKKLGDAASISEIRSHAAHIVRLWTQYESRFVNTLTEPYSGAQAECEGMPHGLWETHVAAPLDFANDTAKRTVPHSVLICECSQCAGVGLLNCSRCGGSGRVTCDLCRGTRSLLVNVEITVSNMYGPNASRTELVSQWCPCNTGTQRCSQCGGSGRATCCVCNGFRRLKTFDQLTVEFTSNVATAHVHSTEIGDLRLKHASGVIVVDERAERISSNAPINSDVDSHVAQLLNASQTTKRNSRILFQRIRIEKITVDEIVYQHANEPAKQLWVYGSEQFLYAPGGPLAWGRIAAIAGIILAVIAAVIVGMIHSGHQA